MSDDELAALAKRTTLFARLAPLHKERIVTLLKREGHVVGFMGDGINDAPALRGGEMTALIGPNGAGKSTLLRLLTGYLTPDSGTRHLAGKPLEAWSPEALSRRRAVMLQRTALQADWTVETVIAMGRSPWGATAD
ncbi:ATP-binding cassette domain-containing protein, partial [Pseudomonas aeruginosa]|nr:ATP-binding cassette domain-containing protein [Pseudomonas aeruginosa]